MQKILSWLFICLLFQTNLAAAFSETQKLEPQFHQTVAAGLTTEILSSNHYKPISLDDSTSAKIFKNYINALDSEHIFFLKGDIDNFSEARLSIDDSLINLQKSIHNTQYSQAKVDILKKQLHFPFESFNLYRKRVSERFNYAKSLLHKPFDFTINEHYTYDREESPWVAKQEQLNDIWRKRVKNDWLRLLLAGKGNDEIIRVLTKRYDNSISSISKIKSDDVFQSFMNAYATTIDPHTNYFGVRAAEDFNISMRLSLVGIGAVLQSKDEYTVIKELVTGGPASLSGLLKVGDRIIGVAQGDTAPMVDVIGWRLDDTVDLIRGEKDSTVVLEILPADTGLNGISKRIALIRQKINLEQQAAKKSIINISDSHYKSKVGVIKLPAFYQDFFARKKGDKNYKSASRDVLKLINELKEEQVDSLLIDLRNNGGGSLHEAIALTGLFIDHGPVLQERNVVGEIQVDHDNELGVAWKGPLAVLINRGSASASEIFAAAIQDYGRGLILGETSYGKGTVQSVQNLDEFTRDKTPRFGEVKMTIAQFFRVNGGTTQLRGVHPDISLPSLTDMNSFGESSYENALPWVKITPANYHQLNNYSSLVSKLKTRHKSRISKSEEFKLLLEDIDHLTEQRNKKAISLNLIVRQKERAMQEANLAKRKKASQSKQLKNPRLIPDDGLLANEREIQTGDEEEFADILLNESAHIISDAIYLDKPAQAQVVHGK